MRSMTSQQLASVKLGKAFRWMRRGSAINRADEDAIAYAVDCVPSHLQITVQADAPQGPWHFEVKSDKLKVQSPDSFASKNETLEGVRNWLATNA